MKNFKVLLQNACEDYFTNLDHEPTLEDVIEVCSTNIDDIADVIWKALARAQENRKAKEENDAVSPTKAILVLKEFAKGIMGQPVGTCIGTLKCLFRDAETYGYHFWYGTTEQKMFYKLTHTPKSSQKIVAYGFIKK